MPNFPLLRSSAFARACLLAAACLLLAPAAASAAGGTISGTVTKPGGQPAPHAIVELYSTTGASPGGPTTDTAGHYTQSNLAPGSYRLAVTDEGGDPSRTWPDQAYDGKAAVEDGDLVQITEGGTTTLNIALKAGGTVSGTVTNLAGSPVDGIQASFIDTATGHGARANAVSSLPSGGYSVRLLPGSYLALFTPFLGCSGGSLARDYVSQYFDTASSASAATPVSVALGGTRTNVNAKLHPGADVSGTITDAGGVPLENVVAEAIDTSSGEVRGGGSSDSSGAYTMCGLPAGSFTVRFQRYDASGNVIDTTYYGSGTTDGGTPVSIAEGGRLSSIDGRFGATPPTPPPPAPAPTDQAPTPAPPTTTAPAPPPLLTQPTPLRPLTAADVSAPRTGSAKGVAVSVTNPIDGATISAELRGPATARGASATVAKAKKQVVYGRAVVTAAKAGKVTLKIRGNAKAKTALKKRRRLAVQLVVSLAPQSGAASTVSKSLILAR